MRVFLFLIVAAKNSRKRRAAWSRHQPQGRHLDAFAPVAGVSRSLIGVNPGETAL
jgi:hypothetical protein